MIKEDLMTYQIEFINKKMDIIKKPNGNSRVENYNS